MSLLFGGKKPSKVKCCVPNCDDKYSSRYCFPNPINERNMVIMEKWISNINNPLLSNRSYGDIHKKFRVCARHFPEETILHGCRRGISDDAVPILYINNEQYRQVTPEDHVPSTSSSHPGQFHDENVCEGKGSTFEHDTLLRPSSTHRPFASLKVTDSDGIYKRRPLQSCNEIESHNGNYSKNVDSEDGSPQNSEMVPDSFSEDDDDSIGDPDFEICDEDFTGWDSEESVTVTKDDKEKSPTSSSCKVKAKHISEKLKLVEQPDPEQTQCESNETNWNQCLRFARKLSRSELSEICIEKIYETLQLQQTIKNQEEKLEILGRDMQKLSKEYADLNIVHTKLLAKYQNQNANSVKKPVVPEKTTRSIGLQARLPPRNANHQNMRRQNMSNTQQKTAFSSSSRKATSKKVGQQITMVRQVSQKSLIRTSPRSPKNGSILRQLLQQQYRKRPKHHVTNRTTTSVKNPVERVAIAASSEVIDLTYAEDRLTQQSKSTDRREDPTEKSPVGISNRASLCSNSILNTNNQIADKPNTLSQGESVTRASPKQQRMTHFGQCVDTPSKHDFGHDTFYRHRVDFNTTKCGK